MSAWPWNKRQQGVTLVELMIALVVSAIVLLGVATVYTSSKRAYKIQEEMSRLQENVRFAFTELTTAIRNAGNLGDLPNLTLNCIVADPTLCADFQSGINGFEYVASPTTPGSDYTITSLTDTATPAAWTNANGNPLPNWLAGQVLAGNDVLITASTEPAGNVELDCPPAASTATSLTTLGPIAPIDQGRLVFLTDGLRADLFQNVSASNASTLNRGQATGLPPGNVNPASTEWTAPTKCIVDSTGNLRSAAEVMVANHTAFYVGIGASGNPALFLYRTGEIPQAEELIEGVENMQILYGIDNTPQDDNYQPDQYVSANDAALDFDNVRAIRISLLVRTPRETNRPQQAGTFRLLGVDNATSVDVTTLADRRIRKVFTTTVQLRNKAFSRQEFE